MLRLLLNAELWSKLLAILLHNHLYNKQDLLYNCRRHTVPQVPVHSGAGTRFINNSPPGLPVENGSRYFRLRWLSRTWSRLSSMLAISRLTRAARIRQSGKAGAVQNSHGGRYPRTSPIAFDITGGQINDCTHASALIRAGRSSIHCCRQRL
ncbi:hypothetical protein SAMN05216379_10130 [Nitrosomonas eutropha]|uniref:Secreted protein n=1 Tax=Nitrosomonas eutropha TaxID=916 RepID=A0ABX5M917_9PROT|nr:hypothetical protein C8R14_10427 [Nitrosomonas eutropha]SCW99703.1 hypothetical protein SAMN05216379_10130 [Nitrosomonas eutropha]SEI59681.1 hypothetical protein SAMN05216318_10687 [Nitrosomonas eutropha]